jgi:methionine aminotransferase
MQYALADFLQNEHNYLGLSAFYQQKRDYFLQLLQGSRFSWIPAQGSYFQLLDYSQITNQTDTDFAVQLTREKGVASIPISVFYTNAPNQKVLRFCFAKQTQTLEKAAEILQKL